MPSLALLTVALLAALGAAEPHAGQDDLGDTIQCQSAPITEQLQFKIPDAQQPTESPGGLRLLDTVLVASVDGQFHALDRTTGHKLWTTPIADIPTSSWTNESDHISPGQLVSTQHPSLGNVSTEELFIIEPQSGALFLLPSDAPRGETLRRFPFTIPYLDKLSPYVSEGRTFLSEKKTSVFALELDSGRLHRWHNTTSSPCDSDVTPKLQVFIERTDYNVTVSRPGFTTQKLGFSAYHPVDNDTQQSWHQTPDGIYIQPTSDGRLYAISATTGSFKWQVVGFPQPIVAVFDVVDSLGRLEATALLQPQPNLIAEFPDFAQAISEEPNKNYVGTVNGSLFAMSSNSFPFTRFEKASDDTADRNCNGLECFTGVHLT